MTDTTEMRCRQCIAIGCECPKGYSVENLKCDVCGYAFVLAAAKCAASIVKCPECNGNIDGVEDA